MNLEEAINTAIAFEKKVVDVYAKSADSLTSSVAAKVFEALRKEEEEHVAYLKAKQDQWQKLGKVTLDDLKSIVPDPETIKANIKKLKKEAKKEVIDSEIKAFKNAYDMEIKATEFYRNLVAKLPPDQQPLFQRFLEIEEGHEAIVKAEIDNALGLGYWFDFMEFDLEVA